MSYFRIRVGNLKGDLHKAFLKCTLSRSDGVSRGEGMGHIASWLVSRAHLARESLDIR